MGEFRNLKKTSYRIIYGLTQWIWGFPQNLIGLLLCIRLKKYPKRQYNGNIVSVWDKSTSLSLGMFLFLTPNADEWLVKHECGHSLQSMQIGPFYLVVIGIPSFLWCNLPFLQHYRKKKNISYYAFFTERWANHLMQIPQR